MNASFEYKDLAGKLITVGSFIVYAANFGRCAVLKYGIVTRFNKRKDIYNNSREIPTLKVLTVDRTSRREAGQYLYSWNLQNKGKEITLAFFDRMIVVNKNDIPQEALNLLTSTNI